MGVSPSAEKIDGRVGRRKGTREAIMEAATVLFAARGVTSTSIDEIAEKAGIAKGSIYYNFESKSGLVEAIMERSGDLLGEGLRKATAGRSGRELRIEVVRVLLQLVRDHDDEAQVMVTELFRVERSWQESIQAWRDRALNPLVDDLVAEGMEPVIARFTAASIVGATLFAGLEWLVFHPERDYDEVTQAVLETLNYR